MKNVKNVKIILQNRQILSKKKVKMEVDTHLLKILSAMYLVDLAVIILLQILPLKHALQLFLECLD